MRKYYQAEQMKYRRTFLKKLAIFMPLVTALLAAWLMPSYFAVNSYNWWYVGLYPGYIGVLCGCLGGKDKGKKNHTIWSLPCSMGNIWDAKLLVGAKMSGLAMLCMLLFTGVIGKLMEVIGQVQYVAPPSVAMQLAAGVVMWLTTLWQIPVCLYLSQKMGTFLMLILHTVLNLALAVTVSLKPFFALFPGAITARLMCPVLGVLPNGLLLQPESMTYAPQLAGTENLLIGIPAALLWLVLFWLGSRRWFERQVNRQ